MQDAAQQLRPGHPAPGAREPTGPTDPPGRRTYAARASLRNALYVLRVILQPDPDPLACSRYILSQGEDIRLHLSRGSSYDVRAFEDGIERAHDLATKGTDPAIEALRGAFPCTEATLWRPFPMRTACRTNGRISVNDGWTAAASSSSCWAGSPGGRKPLRKRRGLFAGVRETIS